MSFSSRSNQLAIECMGRSSWLWDKPTKSFKWQITQSFPQYWSSYWFLVPGRSRRKSPLNKSWGENLSFNGSNFLPFMLELQLIMEMEVWKSIWNLNWKTWHSLKLYLMKLIAFIEFLYIILENTMQCTTKCYCQT